jgi:thioredoxin-related protein
MKNGFMIALLFFGVLGVQARIWTNAQGKTLDAELVRVKDGQAFLKLTKNRQIHSFDISALAKDDQDFIEKYQQEQAEKLKAQALQERKARWHEEFADAKAESEEFGLPILLLYTAPSWCGYCVKLEDRVFDTSEFKKFANGNLVLLMADFSNSGSDKKWKKKNTAVSSKFKAGGFPCMFFITKDTEKIGRLGGYEEAWSTSDYLEKMTKIIKK